MLKFVSTHVPWNTISNLELRRSYEVLRDELMRPSTTTLRNISRREYTLTVDAIRTQLQSRNKFSSAFNGRTSTNKLAIMSVITYHMNPNGTLCEVELALDDVDRLIFSDFES
jgi:hypothetical protein